MLQFTKLQIDLSAMQRTTDFLSRFSLSQTLCDKIQNLKIWKKQEFPGRKQMFLCR